MFKDKKVRIFFIVMIVIFGITFNLGVFGNPNFNIYDFCMNLSSEIVGLAIALVLVESYVGKKKKKGDTMEQPTKTQLEKTTETIKSFKQMISEKGTKKEVISYLMSETGLTKEECESAYDFYDNIQLPDK